ncbi:hypothetical protein V2J09_010873 [Rumex salicifolius]
MMDEARRCRRTDGKRWRCSKEVIPHEKYCQTHMHRGCRRSRKLVESSSIPTCIPHLNSPKSPPNLNLKLPTSPINGNAGAVKIKKPSTTNTGGTNEGKNDDDKAEAEERLKTINLEFSPQSVLGQGESSETRRCRRTDGKRWRCTKEVIGEDHKYCANHMYRGAKKRYECNPNPYALVKRDDKLVVAFDTNP